MRQDLQEMLEEKINDMEDKISDLQDEMDEIEEKMEVRVEDDADDLEGRMEEIEDEIKAIREQIAEYDDYLSDIRGKYPIHDDDIDNYLIELIKGDTDTKSLGWIADFIAWEDAAETLKNDYTIITVDGEDYWYID